ncbi:hypothetical protein, partial [Actinoplanes xinjiangensis]|uniref:hypothetical protein n=1 Tax=Actinoplanes xinjiangensis TaxID=512350 RepID=UPI00342625FF
QYTLTSLTARDYIAHQLNATLNIPVFTLTGTVDTAAPVVDMASVVWLSEPTLDNSVNRTIKMQVRVTDDVSGIAVLMASVTSPDGRFSVTLGNGTRRLLSGTTTDGVWELTGTVPAYSPLGQYTLTSLTARDYIAHQLNATLNIPVFTLTGTVVVSG